MKARLMKALIWICCVVIAAIVQTILGYIGFVGTIPAVIVFIAMTAVARFFCKEYGEKQNGKMEVNTFSENTSDGQKVSPDINEQSLHICPQCGKNVVEGSSFCSYCGKRIGDE